MHNTCNSGILERLQPVESEEAMRARIATGIEVFRSMQDVLGRFDNVHLVPQHLDAGGIVTPNIEKAVESVATVIDSKVKKKASHGAADTLKSAAEAAIQVPPAPLFSE